MSGAWAWPLGGPPRRAPPGPGDPAAFGTVRRHDVHTGIDLHCPPGTPALAVEAGTVAAVVDFTGPAAGSPWWLPTRAVLVEGASGVVCYGEVEERPGLVPGAAVRRGEPLGAVARVLRHDKGRPTSMLHLELYAPGTREPVEWRLGEPRPAPLRDPTPWLAACAPAASEALTFDGSSGNVVRMTRFRDAATLVLVRPGTGPTGLDVAWVHRARGLRFLGDFWVFPGGQVDRADPGPEDACLREAFEEAGVLLGERAPAADAAHELRLALLAGGATWPDVAPWVGATTGRERLVACGRWKTPPFGPVRYDTRFYLALAPEGCALRVVPGEIDAAEWIDPAAALARWRADEALLAPPTRVTLEVLAASPGDPTAPAWLPAAAARILASRPPGGEYLGGIDFRPGLRVFPVRTPTLPPATHTNCYVVGDGSQVVVIDPASPYPEEQARLDALLADLAAQGVSLREVLLTHHHHDHSSGADHVAERWSVPVAAHEGTRARLGGRVRVDRLVADGERIELPADRPGARPRRLRAVLTEGHADGHLAFLEEHTNGLVAGDMVAGTGTILIDPPEGRMSTYLESLRALQALAPRLIYPAHGPPIGDPTRLLGEYVEHRLMRERKVLAAVVAGAGPVEELVPRAYDDASPDLYPLAARSALAHLAKLEDEGLVRSEGEVWRARAP